MSTVTLSSPIRAVQLFSAAGPRLTPMRKRRIMRLVRTAVLAVIVIATAWLLALHAFFPAAGSSSATPVGDNQIVHVNEGDSLWTIAVSVAGDRDPRDVMIDIAELNNLQSQVVHPGQELAVPSR